jgi:hypothetical protein
MTPPAVPRHAPGPEIKKNSILNSMLSHAGHPSTQGVQAFLPARPVQNPMPAADSGARAGTGAPGRRDEISGRPENGHLRVSF